VSDGSGKSSRLVYSTGSGRIERDEGSRGKPGKGERPPPGDGIVRIRREVKGRRGKTVTTVSGLAVSGPALHRLATELKRRCGAGGSIRDGVLEIQGDHTALLADELTAHGFRVKRAGG